MTWLSCSSHHQILSHSLCAIWLWWTVIHVYWFCFRLVIPCPFTRKTHGMGGNTSISVACGSSPNNILHSEDGLVVLQVPPNLVPQLGWSMAWMDIIPMYWLCFRLVIPCVCIRKICVMLGNTSMAWHSLPNNIHHPDNGLVFVLPKLGTHSGWNGCEEDVAVQSTTTKTYKTLCIDAVWICEHVPDHLGPPLLANTP